MRQDDSCDDNDRDRLDQTLRCVSLPILPLLLLLFLSGKPLFTQRRSVVKSVGRFQRHLFACVCVRVCVFVCQHDNFRTSKHRMMKLGE